MAAPWIIAHRGASGHAPENTMAAFRRAVELGAGFIETDLHLTRDAQLVAIHDDTLDRTTTGRGAVKDFTLAELRELDAGSWFAPEFAGERIPTLKEIIEFARETDVALFLEVKAAAIWGIEHAVVNALRDSGEAAGIVVLSFQESILASVHRLDRTLMTGFLFDRPVEKPIAMAQRIGARQLAPRADLVRPEMVEEAHREGLQVVAWSVNDPEHMRALVSEGVDGIMTDFPDRLRAILESR